MDIDYVRRKITELRIKKGLSEYRLSYDTGHSKNYIHNIVMGHSQPSVSELLYLIEVLGVTPRDFLMKKQNSKIHCSLRKSWMVSKTCQTKI